MTLIQCFCRPPESRCRRAHRSYHSVGEIGFLLRRSAHLILVRCRLPLPPSSPLTKAISQLRTWLEPLFPEGKSLRTIACRVLVPKLCRTSTCGVLGRSCFEPSQLTL